MSKLYIAYGANLNKRAMRIRCQTARPLGKFYLTDAQLVFRGVADVEYCPGGKVPCGLWSINQADERSLDMFEGVRSGLYYKEWGVVLKYVGRARNALMYLMKSEGVYPPSQAYVDTIRRGYKDFGLDESYLDDAIARSFEEKAPDIQTKSRRQRQRQDGRNRELVKMPESVAMNRIGILRGEGGEADDGSEEKGSGRASRNLPCRQHGL